MRNLFLVLVLACAAPAGAIQVEKIRVAKPLSSGGGSADVEVVSGQALVRFSASMGEAARRAALSARGMSFVKELPPTGWTLVDLPAGMPVSGGLIQLRTVAGVEEAEPNHAYRPFRVPNDPLFASQYHLGKINAPAAWEYETGGTNKVTIAVVDSGVDQLHPDLSPNYNALTVPKFCDPGPTKTTGGGDEGACVTESPSTAACNHGTRVAGTAAARGNNGTGATGVSWNAQWLSVRVFRAADCDSSCANAGANSCATDDPTLINAINYVVSVNNGANYGRVVLNMSIGEEGTACPAAIQNAINAAVATSTGVVMVVSAGNAGSSVSAPANCAGVIPVGATDSNDNIASFSNSGPELASNGVVAPGVGICTTDINNGTTCGAKGTSFAAPIVSGLAALILSAKPTLSPTQVRDALRGSAESIGVASLADAARPNGNSAGAGRVNAFRALKLVTDGTLAGFAGDEKVIAFPNPFRTQETGSVTITIPPGLAGKNPKIKIYTIDGQLVRDLHAQTTWDAKNDHGRFVATGVYLVLVKTDNGSQTARVAVIR